MKTFIQMEKTVNEKVLTLINFIIVLYFLAVFSVYFFKMDHVAIGVVLELFTIPFLIAQLIFLYVGVKRFFAKEKISLLYLLSIAALAICIILTVGSFFW